MHEAVSLITKKLIARNLPYFYQNSLKIFINLTDCWKKIWQLCLWWNRTQGMISLEKSYPFMLGTRSLGYDFSWVRFLLTPNIVVFNSQYTTTRPIRSRHHCHRHRMTYTRTMVNSTEPQGLEATHCLCKQLLFRTSSDICKRMSLIPVWNCIFDTFSSFNLK